MLTSKTIKNEYTNSLNKTAGTWKQNKVIVNSSKVTFNTSISQEWNEIFFATTNFCYVLMNIIFMHCWRRMVMTGWLNWCLHFMQSSEQTKNIIQLPFVLQPQNKRKKKLPYNKMRQNSKKNTCFRMKNTKEKRFSSLNSYFLYLWKKKTNLRSEKLFKDIRNLITQELYMY